MRRTESTFDGVMVWKLSVVQWPLNQVSNKLVAPDSFVLFSLYVGVRMNNMNGRI